MEQIYYDVKHPAGFSSVDKLADAAGVTREKAKEFLQTSDTYTLHKPLRKRFKRRKTIAHARFELYQSDLAEFQPLARHNRGYRFVVICKDVLSKYVWYVPIKKKTPDEIIRAFKQIFKTAKPKLIQTDFGKEYHNKKFADFLKKHNVKHYSTFSEVKASLAERQIRTLKEQLTKIFHYRGSKKYYDLLPSL